MDIEIYKGCLIVNINNKNHTRYLLSILPPQEDDALAPDPLKKDPLLSICIKKKYCM